MTPRTPDGRFTTRAKAAEAHADAVLEAAVAEAVRRWRTVGPCHLAHLDVFDHWCIEQGAIALRLREMCNAADLLYGEAS